MSGARGIDTSAATDVPAAIEAETDCIELVTEVGPSRGTFLPIPSDYPSMSATLREAVAEPVRDAVPFLIITVLWVVVMVVLYGLFLVTKPSDITYDAWVHATVFVVPAIGFLGQVLQQALSRQHRA
ncbi:hypothetical protein [Haloarcula sp. H-GB5]